MLRFDSRHASLNQRQYGVLINNQKVLSHYGCASFEFSLYLEKKRSELFAETLSSATAHYQKLEREAKLEREICELAAPPQVIRMKKYHEDPLDGVSIFEQNFAI